MVAEFDVGGADVGVGGCIKGAEPGRRIGVLLDTPMILFDAGVHVADVRRGTRHRGFAVLRSATKQGHVAHSALL